MTKVRLPEQRNVVCTGGASRARHPLVVVEASASGRAAVAAGIECAYGNRGRLSVIYLLQPRHQCWAGPVAMGALIPPRQADELVVGEEILARVRNDVPSDVPVCTALLTARYGHCKQVLAIGQALGCDAIIVPLARRLFGLRMGLGAELVRHSELPVVLVEHRASQSTATYGTWLPTDASMLEAVA